MTFRRVHKRELASVQSAPSEVVSQQTKGFTVTLFVFLSFYHLTQMFFFLSRTVSEDSIENQLTQTIDMKKGMYLLQMLCKEIEWVFIVFIAK